MPNTKQLDIEQLGRELVALRDRMNAQIERDITQREREHPELTPLEVHLQETMGHYDYIEWLEPPVRETVLRMNELGYTTLRSGFSPPGETHPTYYQSIMGEFRLSQEIKERLNKIGVSVDELEYFGVDCTEINFTPQIASEQWIEQKWKEVQNIIPPTGHPAYPSKAHEEQRRRVEEGLKRQQLSSDE